MAKDPGFGLAWVQLGRLYAANYSFDVAPIDTPIEEAVALAQRGVRLEPTSQRARAILAMALLCEGELEEGRAEAERALTVCPVSRVYLDFLGWIMTLLGCWERGRQLVDRTVDYSAPPRRVRRAVGRPHPLRQAGRGPQRRAPAHRLPVLLALAHAHFHPRADGRIAEAEQEAAELLRQKPEFPSRGRTLIGRLIKFPEIMNRIVAGLEQAGLHLASGH